MGMYARPAAFRITLLVALSILGSCASPTDAPTSFPDPSPLSLELPAPRAVHDATVLLDGRVLLTGGCSTPGCGGFESMRESVWFDPGTSSFSSGPTMQSARASGTSTLLPDGRVLLAGGFPGEGKSPITSAEIFEPTTETFTSVGNLTMPRADHTATVLPDGTVLLIGGTDGAAPLRSTEIFDPRTGRFQSGPAMPTSRSGHAAILVGAQLVVFGGTADGFSATAETAVLTGITWTTGPRLQIARVKHGAALLPDDRILIVGGATDIEGGTKVGTTEILSLTDSTVVGGPTLLEPVYKLDGAIATMADGRIVVGGGAQLQVYDPDLNAFSGFGPNLSSRSFATLSLLQDDRLLFAGGYDNSISPLTEAILETVP